MNDFKNDSEESKSERCKLLSIVAPHITMKQLAEEAFCLLQRRAETTAFTAVGDHVKEKLMRRTQAEDESFQKERAPVLYREETLEVLCHKIITHNVNVFYRNITELNTSGNSRDDDCVM